MNHRKNMDHKHILCGTQPEEKRKRIRNRDRWLYRAMLGCAAFFCVTVLAGCSAGPEETVRQTEEVVEYIGGVYAVPVADGVQYQAPAGTDILWFFVERAGVGPGEGVLTVYRDTDDTVVEEITAGSGQVTFAPVSAEHMEYYGMDGGTEIQICLNSPLEAGTGYYVTVSEDFVRYDAVKSRAWGGRDVWPIQVESE